MKRLGVIDCGADLAPVAPLAAAQTHTGCPTPALSVAHADTCDVWSGHYSRATWDRCTCDARRREGCGDPMHLLDDLLPAGGAR